MPRLPMVSPVERALFLRAQPYLDGLPSSVLTALASYTEERLYRAGAEIRARGAAIDRILFLGTGAVAVGGPHDAPLRTKRIDAPGAVGLAHHFAGSSHPPSVSAIEESLCLEISTRDLDQILEDHFPLVHQMATTSCEQVVMTLEALADDRAPEEGFAQAEPCETPAELDLVQRLSWAKRAPFFRDTNLTLLASLTGARPPRFVVGGDFLWKAGEPIDAMALVLDGRFHSDGKFGRATAAAGAVIGAWEIMIPGVHFEGWIADVPSRVIQIPRDLFVDFLEDHVEFGQSYLRSVSSKLVEGWEVLARLGRDVP